jgi:ribokinase
MGKIVILGSINMDVVVMAPKHPQPGETIFGTGVQFIPGGKGSNQAVAAARLADGVALVGRLGRDAFGAALSDFLAGENLSLQYLSYSETAPSGTALITVDQHAENRIIVVSGANFELSPDQIEPLAVDAGDTLVSVFEVPQETIRAAFLKARSVGARTILNPAPAASFIDGLQELCETLVVNETELAFFAGQAAIPNDLAAIKRQAQAIRSQPEQAIIVTLGAHGAVALQGTEFFSVPGRAVEAVDTTAAGDCFVGSLAVALDEGLSLRQAMSFANTTASLSVGKIGASTSLPFRWEVEAALEDHG